MTPSVFTVDPARGVLRSERGALLVGLMVAVGILLVFTTVAVQAWSTTIRRDREDELIFRGKQIAMAIALYRKDHGAPPADLEQLKEPGGPGGGHYYLRRFYKDPMTDDGEWGLVYLSPQGGVITSSGIERGREASGAGAPLGETTRLQPVTTNVGMPIIGVHSKSEEPPMGPEKWRGGLKYSEWLFTIEDVGFPVSGTRGQQGTPTQPGTAVRPGGGRGRGGTGSVNPGTDRVVPPTPQGGARRRN